MADYAQQESETLIVKQRFDSFRLGQRSPSSPSNFPNGRSSHSRASSFSVSNSAQNSTPHDSAGAKRNSSHHRRRSSVSTRTETADMMGVALPSLPRSPLEDNINLGDKDSIRRRALWALEGKTEVAFQKVEIPELSADIEQPTFDISPVQPSFSGNKRDSFRALSPSLSLQTLVEEEEEEEPSRLRAPVPFKKTSRPRPLNLRPLSLTPNQPNLPGLLTPILTPSPRIRSAPLAAPYSDDSRSSWSKAVSKSNMDDTAMSSGLPSPAVSPSDRLFSSESTAQNEAPRRRPLSTGEQHFLFESHQALLARITDLENTVSRSQSGTPDANRDAEALRQRVSDLDKQVVLLTERLDSERRDTWTARSHASLIEVEKAALQTALETERKATLNAKSERDRLSRENIRLAELLKHETEKSQKELAALRTLLQTEQKSTQELRSELKTLQKPSSVGQLSTNFVFGGRRELSPTRTERSHSEIAVKVEAVKMDIGVTHAARASLSKTWTFPNGPAATVKSVDAPPVDRFFMCLDEIDELSPSLTQSYESSKETFAKGIKMGSEYFVDDEDDMPPFYLPDSVAIAAVEHIPRSLDVVMEEDEEEEYEQEKDEEEEEEEEENDFGIESSTTLSTRSNTPISSTPSPSPSCAPVLKSKPSTPTFIRQPKRTVSTDLSISGHSVMQSVDLSSPTRKTSKHGASASFSALVTSPLSAFTNFTLSSFLSPRPSADAASPSSPDHSQPRFVSKAQQLERLQTRMHHEHHKTGIPPADACLPCTGDIVFL